MWHKGPKPNDGIGRSCPISEFGFCEKKNPPVNVIKLIGRKKVEISHVTETTRKGYFKRN